MRSSNRSKYPWLAFLAAATLLGACERPHERVIAPAAENLSRNAASGADAVRAVEEAVPAPSPRAAMPSPAAISDAFIAGKVRAALVADPGMSGADVSVNVEHGVVVLAGNVKSYEQAGIASAYAQRQDGVMRVDNQLTLALQ
jgi:hyperosmotically inducible periplasmic protein